MQMMHIKTPTPMHVALKRQAHRQNKTLSAVAREAMALWLAQYGDVVDPVVQRGGYNPPKAAAK